MNLSYVRIPGYTFGVRCEDYQTGRFMTLGMDIGDTSLFPEHICLSHNCGRRRNSVVSVSSAQAFDSESAAVQAVHNPAALTFPEYTESKAAKARYNAMFAAICAFCQSGKQEARID